MSASVFEDINKFNVSYAACIDDDELEDWPDFFTEDCFYKVTTVDNYKAGRPAGLMYADSKGMLSDRISALREANIYESHRYRHLIGMPLVSPVDDIINSETPFFVSRIMRGGEISMFATGKYVDELVKTHSGIRIKKRVVVCDSISIDTLLAIPL
jgi:3-phenylpropionate/cinnamic acid dioxygenase small subunit